ncbi:hypothetical protein ERJ75_000599000 [Trypanosoma vivax]|nr:hypothetical protein ERJ75_000599000 [Trypanosoma vivax]
MGTRQRHGTSTGRRGRAPGRQRGRREAERSLDMVGPEEQIGTRSGCGEATAAAGKSAREVSRRTGTGLDWNESEQIEGTAQGCREKENTRDREIALTRMCARPDKRWARMRPRHATDAEGEMTTCKAAERWQRHFASNTARGRAAMAGVCVQAERHWRPREARREPVKGGAPRAAMEARRARVAMCRDGTQK